MQNAAGAILSPFDAWLVLRGTKTLPLRMAQHNANGQALAEFLAGHPKVTRVSTPGCRTIRSTRWPAADAGLRRHARVRWDRSNGRGGAQRVQLMALAESLGGVVTPIPPGDSLLFAAGAAGGRAARRRPLCCCCCWIAAAWSPAMR